MSTMREPCTRGNLEVNPIVLESALGISSSTQAKVLLIDS
jgi:hypothetical protein